ncbi:MAG TPA: zinc ribbon domain-containing protein YjdM, partial [Opitutus sp.]|nr:zinc ribbon domain-containing protein YjdM [Opitutus sp.]
RAVSISIRPRYDARAPRKVIRMERASLRRQLLACSPPSSTANFTNPVQPTMSTTPPPCPVCTLEDVLSHSDHWECATCGHEWPKEAAPEAARVVKDAHGTVLAEGDTIALIKDLKLGSGSQVLKAGTKAKNIRLVDGDHEIACKIDGSSMALKACFVKKA